MEPNHPPNQDRSLGSNPSAGRAFLPRFRTSTPGSEATTTVNGAGFTLPGLSSQLNGALASGSNATGFVSLRRSTRSLNASSPGTTPVKTELVEFASATTSTPRKRVKREAITPLVTPTRTSSTPIIKSEPLDDDLIDINDIKPSSIVSPDAKRKISTPKKAMPLAPLAKAHPAPARWEEQYRLIEEMRRGLLAPVDTMGCERPDLGPVPEILDPSSSSSLAPPLSPSIERALPAKTRRFHVLVSLMLSSQTKDAVTSAAVTSLHHTLPGGLTTTSLAAAEREVVEGCINKVGFWRRKAGYIQEAAQRLEAEDLDKSAGVAEGEWESGEIPRTIEGLCALKGVGPKMAYLALQCAWDINAGIGVDVHVHRITNRLKWHKPPTATPEQTRVNLESWLPKELHKGINPMLVGFGQMICQPVGPRCDICLLGIKRICPSRVAGVKAEGRKVVEYTYSLQMEGGKGGNIPDLEDSIGCLGGQGGS